MLRALCPTMGRTRKGESIDLGTLSGRLLALMAMGQYHTKIAFCDALGWKPSRLSNYIKRQEITKEAFYDIRNVFPGVTWEWIHEGNPDQLSVGFSRRIREVSAPSAKGKGATLPP